MGGFESGSAGDLSDTQFERFKETLSRHGGTITQSDLKRAIQQQNVVATPEACKRAIERLRKTEAADRAAESTTLTALLDCLKTC